MVALPCVGVTGAQNGSHAFGRNLTELSRASGGLRLWLPQQLQTDVTELLHIGGRRRAGHRFFRLLVFGKGDDFADRLLTSSQHHDAIEAIGEAAVGRRTEAKRIQEESEPEL